MLKYLYIFIIITFSGCLSTNQMDIKSEDYTTTREYPNISKDAIFEALKKVFILDGGDQFRIDSYRDNLEVSKTKVSIYPFFVYSTDDIWNINIEEIDNRSIVKVSLKRVKEYDKEDAKYLSKDLHNLLLDRAEYLLGLKDNWRSCLGNFTFDDALCDMVDLKSYKTPTKEDKIKNVLISQRKESKGLAQIQNDILEDDIVLSLDDSEDDILDKVDENIQNDLSEDQFDKQINELNDKVNENITKTLEKIESDIKDE